MRRKRLSNYANDNTLYSIGNTIESVKKAISNDFRIIQNWFHKNLMVLNAKKCHYMCYEIGSENDEFIFDGIKLPNSCAEKILDVMIDIELKSDPHIRSMCKKAAQKLGVLNRISSLLDPKKKKLVFNAVIKSHFSNCPLVWMFSSRKSHSLINRIHERSLRTVYNDTSKTFQELLQRNRSVSIHHKNIQTLTTDLFKVVNNICPPILKTFFNFRENRYIRNFHEMRQQNVRTVRYGLETALYRAPQLWSLVPADLKSLPNVNLFKSKIKQWKCTECSCILCKTYLKI